MSILDEKTVVLDVCFRRPGIRRKGKLSLVETDADRTLLSLGKKIVDSPEYNDISTVVRKFKDWIKARSTPTGSLREGAYRIPIDLLTEVYNRLAVAKAEYAEKADAFCAAFPALKEAAKERLADQYDESNYVSTQRLRSAFRVDHRLIDYGVPNATLVGEAIHAAEAQEAEVELKQAAEICKTALRVSMLEIMTHFQKALGSRPDGKKAILRETTYERTLEFIDLFAKRDIFNDTATKALVEKARTVLSGGNGFVDSNELRTNEGFRMQVEAATGEIVAKLGALVETSVARAIEFDDDDAE